MGPSAGLNNTGSSVNAFGFNAALNNSGTYVNAFGFNAGSGNTKDSLNAFGANAGMGNKGVNLVAIGSNAGSNNTGDNNISIGDWAGWNLSGASNVAMGFRSLVDNSGSNTIGIGFNAGVSGAATNCIYIGQYAGLSNTRANSIFIGSNPGYSVAANHQFVVYSLSMLPLIQGDLSFNRVGLGKAPGAFALDVSGTIQASNVSLGKLNGVTWSPSTTPGTGTVPTYTGSSIEWQIPGADAAAWSTFRATQAVNLSGYDLSGIVSFNSLSAVFVSGNRRIGLGQGVLTGNTGTDVVAFGTAAGSNGSTNNMIFLGSNPGYNPAVSNALIVYSTSAGVPFLQGDVSGRLLGIGRAPRAEYALDVCGTVAASSFFTVPGAASTIGPVYISNSAVGIGALPGPTIKLDVQGSLRVSNITTNEPSATNTIGGITLSNTTLSAATVNVNTLCAGRLLFGDVVALGSSSLSGNTAQYANALGFYAGYGNSQSNCTFIGKNPSLVSSGATAPNTFLVYSTSVAPTIQADTSNNYVGIGKVPGAYALDVSGTANVVSLSAQSVTTSIVNTSSIRIVNSTVVGLGSNSLSGNTAQHANALGFYAGYSNTQSNCTFIGKNPSLVSSGATAPNTFLVYSTSTAAPTIQADTSNNYVGIGRVPGTYALDVSGAIRTTSNIINTVNVSVISTNTFTLSPTNASTYFNLVYASGCNITIALPGQTDLVRPMTYLVVGGGGGGGSRNGGGGGAGGYTTGSLTRTAGVQYTVTVGSGGPGGSGAGSGSGNAGGDGTDSVFSTITVGGGGGGGQGDTGAGRPGTANGGSGGGGAGRFSSGGGAATGTGVGNAGGGNSSGVSPGGGAAPYMGGGGGGAGAVGGVGGGSPNTGTGGIGRQNDITGTNLYYAGGGGGAGARDTTGGTGGLGGGGAGSVNNLDGSPGQANTGGGGGGGNFLNSTPQQSAGGVGGSGVVIISYLSTYPELEIGNGLTQTNSIVGGNRRVYIFTAGTGTISWGTGPILEAATGAYWVIKNNSPINYTLNFTGGTLNTVGGPTSMYLQAGNGLTLINSGANTVYYTF